MNINHNDEISLVELLSIIYKSRILILKVMVVSFIICLTYNFLVTPKYECTTTFILNSENNLNMGNLGVFGSVFMSNTGGLSNYVDILVKSRLFKVTIAENFKSEYKGKSVKEIVAKLNFYENLKLDHEGGLYVLRYLHQDPAIAKKVVDLFNENLEAIIIEKELSSNKNLFTVIDKSEMPESPSYPKKGFNLIFTLVASFVMSLVFVVTRSFFV